MASSFLNVLFGRKSAAEDITQITNEEEATMELNNFFSNAVINLKISKFENFDPLLENIENILWKLLLNIENIQALLQWFKECFSFNTITTEGALKEISMLDSWKVMEATNIPIKVIKVNSIFFAEQIWAYFDGCICKGKFPNCLKLANIKPVFRCTYFK